MAIDRKVVARLDCEGGHHDTLEMKQPGAAAGLPWVDGIMLSGSARADRNIWHDGAHTLRERWDVIEQGQRGRNDWLLRCSRGGRGRSG
jgi:hypothetical protein